MSFFDKHSGQFRIALAILAVALSTIAIITFYNFAGSPTDENLFNDPPSNLYITKGFPASVLSESEAKGKEGETHYAVDEIKRGDLLVAINGKYIKSLSDGEKILSWIKDSSDVTLYIFRPSTAEKLTFRMVKKAIPDSHCVQLPSHVVNVIGITPGGASDRAGMKLGDLIYRINGESFSNAQNADQILRTGTSGNTIVYDVYRDGQSIPLRVTLARFGIPISMLLFFIAGIFYIAFGSFIGFRRPELIAARLLALSFLLLGYFIAILLIRRDPGMTLFIMVRNVVGVLCGSLGYVVLIHSTIYFPVKRPELLTRWWLHWVPYGLAGLCIILLLITKNPYAYFGLFAILIYWLVVQIKYRKFRTEEGKRFNRIIKWTSAGVLLVNIILGTITAVTGQLLWIGWMGMFLILIPLAYLYTIGRYRLLGLDLRIRRNVRYTLATIVWGSLIGLGLIWCFTTLPSVELPLRNLVVTGTSIEMNDAPEFREQRILTQKIMLMVIAVVLTYAAFRLRQAGQKLIDRRYHRSRYDYRRAVAELSEVMTSKITMLDLAWGIVRKLAELMHIKNAGILYFRNEKICCCQQAYGIEEGGSKELCLTVDEKMILALKGYRGVFRVADLSPAAGIQFQQSGYQYIVPIQSKDTLIGVLLIGEKLAETTLRQDDIEYLATAATQASVAIENAFLYEELAEKARMQHELEIARNIQLASLPQKTPMVRGLDIAGISVPAMEVGGDFFDYLNGEADAPDILTVIVGDVSGKGTSAALYMSRVQGILRSLHEFAPSPADLFIKANRLLCQDLEKKSFVTAFGALFNTSTKIAVLARAGHLPLFLYRSADQHISKIIPKGIGLGLDKTDIFINEMREESVGYDQGDVFVFVTDGVLEANNEHKEEFGEDRFVQILRNHSRNSAEQLRNSILDEIHKFTGDTYQHDDQTIVVVKAL